MKKLLAALTIIFTTAAVYAAGFPDVSIDQLKADIAAKKVTVIDANGTESWQKGHIPTAINFDANRDKLASLLPSDKNALIVAYCGGPRCHAYEAAAASAEKLGYKNVKHLSAGISGWVEAAQPVEKGS